MIFEIRGLTYAALHKSLFIAFTVLLSIVSTGFSEIIRDTFDTPGPLAGSTPQVGNIWQTNGGSGNLIKSGGSLELAAGVSEEVESFFAPVSNGTIYAAFNFRITTALTKPWVFPFTFRGITFSGGDQVGRIFISTTAGGFRIGVENNMDNPTWWSTPLEQGVEYLAVLAFTENGASDYTTLWLNPTSALSPSISEPLENITDEVFGIRLNSLNNSNGGIAIDNLVVTRDYFAAVPEPSTLVLLGVSVLMLAGLRIRSRREGRG